MSARLHHQTIVALEENAASSSNNNFRQAIVHIASIDINQSVSNNTTDVEGFIDLDVSSEEEVYHEEDVCSPPVVPFEGMEFDSVEKARRVYNVYAFKMGFSIRDASLRKSVVAKELIRKQFECTHARKPASEKEDSTSAITASNDVAKEKASKKRSSSVVLTTATRKRSTIKKYDCKAHMQLVCGKGSGKLL